MHKCIIFIIEAFALVEINHKLISIGMFVYVGIIVCSLIDSLASLVEQFIHNILVILSHCIAWGKTFVPWSSGQDIALVPQFNYNHGMLIQSKKKYTKEVWK